MVEHKWISKEFADDYNIEWDILRRDRYYVHVIDNNDFQKKLDKQTEKYVGSKYMRLFYKLVGKQW